MIFDSVTNILPRYDIQKIIGSGGMGTVYKAWDKENKKTVAIKIITRSSVDNQRLIERFKKEAKIITSLKHANIIKLYDFGEKQNFLYYSMKYIDGKPIDEYIKQKNLSIDEIIFLIIKICKIIDFVNNSNIIHRDIKPSNILMDQNGKPYILDFGIAKDYDQKSLTQTGELLGTVRYISPEQIENKNIDRQSDVYSLGVLLYYLLSNKYPHEGFSAVNLMMKILSCEPIPLDQQGNFPVELPNICMRALSQDREKRHKTAKELACDLESFLKGKYKRKFFWSWKIPLRYIMSSLCIFMIIIILSRIEFIPSQASIDTDPIIEVKNLINLTLYKDANSKIEQIFAKNSSDKNIKQKLAIIQMAIWYGLHEYKKVIEYQEYPPNNANAHLLIAKAHYYSHSNKNIIEKYLATPLKDNNTQIEAKIYQVFLFHKNKQYQKLIDCLLTFSENDLSNYENVEKVYIYAATSYLQKFNLESNNKKHLENAKKYLDKVPISTFSDSLFWETWAHYFLALQDTSKAEEYLQKCCSAEPNNSNYWTQLGKVQLQLEKLSQAYESFYSAIKVAKNDAYVEPLEYLFKFSLYDTRFNEEIFWLISNIFVQKEKIPEPDLLYANIVDIQENYKKNYTLYKKAIEEAKDPQRIASNLKTFLYTLSKKDSYNKKQAIDGIRILAYIFDIPQKIDEYIKEIPLNADEKKRLSNIKNSLIVDLEKQKKGVYYYQLAHFYLFENKETKKELLSQKQIIYEIFANPREQILFRYLAAKVLISLNEYQVLFEHLDTTDMEIKIACLAALQESRLLVNIDYLLDCDVSKNKYQALLYLRALPFNDEKTINQLNYFETMDEKNLVVEKLFNKAIPLLQHDNIEVRISAAAMLWRFLKLDHKMTETAKNILIQMFSADSYILKKYAHFHYWKSFNFIKNPTKEDIYTYSNIFQKEDQQIQIIALDLHLEKELTFLEPLFLDLVHSSYKTTSLKATLFLSNINPENEKFIEWMYSDKLDLTTRVLAAISNGIMVTKIKKKPNIISFMTKLIKYSDYVFENAKFEDEYKAIIYNFFAILGIYYPNALQHNISPNLKANIIAGFCMENVLSKDMRQLSSLFPRNSSLKTRKKYLEESSRDIEKAPKKLQQAIYMSSFFIHPATRQQKYQKALESKDEVFRSAIASGYYRLLYTDITDQIDTFDRDTGLSPFNYHLYIHFLKQYCSNEQKKKKYLGWIDKAIELTTDEKSKAQYFFERAIIKRIQGEIPSALKDIQKAIIIRNQEKFGMLYIIEAAHILYLAEPSEKNRQEYILMLRNYLPFTNNIYEILKVEEFSESLQSTALREKILYRKLIIALNVQLVDDGCKFALKNKILPSNWHSVTAEEIYIDLIKICTNSKTKKLYRDVQKKLSRINHRKY